jgi:SAM-dependent methyltransferase
MQTFWNQRYAENETVYGNEPNKFFKLFIDLHSPGSLLLPAEGEGRNAVYAAAKGWKVDAFDFSEVAREKALDLAKAEKTSIDYALMDICNFIAKKQYDTVALVFVHLPRNIRKRFHEQIYKSVKPGGFLLLEAFAKEQLSHHSGGPSDIDMLYDAASLCSDFPFLHVLSCEQKEIVLNEGPYHQGTASVLRIIGQRL